LLIDTTATSKSIIFHKSDKGDADDFFIELAGTKTFTFDNAGTVTGFSRTYNGELHSSAQRITTLDTLKTNPWKYAHVNTLFLVFVFPTSCGQKTASQKVYH
jgi:hypothetical protein